MSKESASLEGHEIGVVFCKKCCCGPQSCYTASCDGTMHSLGAIDEIDMGDDYGWEWVHEYLCDKCGEYSGY